MMKKVLFGTIAMLILVLGFSGAMAQVSDRQAAGDLATKVAGQGYQVISINSFDDSSGNAAWEVVLAGPGGTKTYVIQQDTGVIRMVGPQATPVPSAAAVTETLASDYAKFGSNFDRSTYDSSVRLTSGQALEIANSNSMAQQAGGLVSTSLVNNQGSFVWQFIKQNPYGTQTLIWVDAFSGNILKIERLSLSGEVTTATSPAQTTLEQDYVTYGSNLDRSVFDSNVQVTSSQALSIADSDPVFMSSGILKSTSLVNKGGDFLWEFTRQASSGMLSSIWVDAKSGALLKTGPSSSTVIASDTGSLTNLGHDYTQYGNVFDRTMYDENVHVTSGQALSIANTDSRFSTAGSLLSTTLVNNAGEFEWRFVKQNFSGSRTSIWVDASSGNIERIVTPLTGTPQPVQGNEMS